MKRSHKIILAGGVVVLSAFLGASYMDTTYFSSPSASVSIVNHGTKPAPEAKIIEQDKSGGLNLK